MTGNGLEGKSALVTGAAMRLGRATALALAGAGARVIVHYRESVDEAESLVSTVRENGGEASLAQADLADSQSLESFFASVAAMVGHVDILVNNASIFPEDSLWDATSEAFEENVRINSWAPFVLTRAMARQDRPCTVVNFLDTRIHDYDRKHVSYHRSKRDLFALTRMTALEFAPKVRVNAVAPGLVLPPPGKDRDYLESLRHSNPLQAIGTPENVAKAVLFLIESDFVTGQIVHVDGGRHMLGGVYG